MRTVKQCRLRKFGRLLMILGSSGLLACAHNAGSEGSNIAGLSQKVQDLQYFVGTWHADVEDPRSGTRATLSYTVEPTLSGAWLEGRGHSPELQLWVRDFWGRDPVNGEIVRTIFDSQGIQGTVRSSGWAGDVLVLEGEARTPGRVVRVRETITRVDDATFRAVWELQAEDKWVTYSVEHLRRAPAAGR
jgi:hypothetical protein